MQKTNFADFCDLAQALLEYVPAKFQFDWTLGKFNFPLKAMRDSSN